jgi:hypothetical protein
MVAKKPRRFYFKLPKKIRSSQKPSWFTLHGKNQKGVISNFPKNKKRSKPFLV